MNHPNNLPASPNRPIRAVIFDFDGLILDTETPVFQTWDELYRSQGGELSLELWSGIIGTVSDDDDLFGWLEKQLGRRLERDELARRRQQREQELIQQQPTRPGVAAYLQDAKQLGLKIGLASSSPCDWVEGHLTRLGLIHYFDCIRASDDVRRVKPDPELYLAVLRELDLPSSQAIVLEDSPIGVMAARRAGLYTIAVPNDLTRQMDLSHANLVVESLESLPLQELLHALGSRSLPPIPKGTLGPIR